MPSFGAKNLHLYIVSLLKNHNYVASSCHVNLEVPILEWNVLYKRSNLHVDGIGNDNVGR